MMLSKDEFMELVAGMGLPRGEEDLLHELEGYVETFDAIASMVEQEPGPYLRGGGERMLVLANLDEAKQFFVQGLELMKPRPGRPRKKKGGG